MKRIVLIIIMLLNINKSSAQGGELLGQLLGLIIAESLSSKTYEKSNHRIELTKTFNNIIIINTILFIELNI